MWQNYLKTVLRSISRHRVYSAINIFGLTTGIACFLLIILYVQYEFSFDRYNSKADRIFRVSLHGVLAGNEINAVATPHPMAATLEREFPEVESATRLREFFRDTLVGIDANRYIEKRIFHADPALFDIFDFTVIAGDLQTALVDPFSVVITETIARKYFGNATALGQSLTFNNDTDYRVTAVVADMPENAHFHPDILVSFNSDEDHDSQIWISNNIHTYFLARPGVSIDELTEKFQELVVKYVGPQIEQAMGIPVQEFFGSGGAYAYGLQPLNDIHLSSHLEGEIEQNGNANYVLTFMAVAIFILLLACVNYMNLSTARSANRAREIGLRKVIGAQRYQLALQFLSESIVITLIAILMAVPIVALLMPAFSALIERNLTLDLLLNWKTLPLLLGFALIIGVLAGSYPALYLSNFKPQAVLKGTLSKGAKSSWLRGLLVVFQFAISIALVSATLIVFAQLEFMRNKPLGFDNAQVLIIHRANTLGDSLQSFLQQIKLQPGVVNAASSGHVPGMGVDQNVYVLEGDPSSASKALWSSAIGYDYIETLGFNLLEGRTYSRDFGEDENAYIVNERAASELGITNPTQYRLVEPGPQGTTTGQIIGMVEDFHFESLHQEIRPMVFRLTNLARFVSVRVEPVNILQTISAIQDTWNSTTNGEPFEYSFLDADFDNLHQSDRRLGMVFTVFAALAILIACLGLYGLASYTTQQRTKEIGIRKTLGANLSDIVVLMAKDFMWLVVGAIVIAVPLALLAMNQWLQLFSYRVNMPVLAFVYSGLIAFLIAFVTVSLQSIRTGLKNPTLSLRDE